MIHSTPLEPLNPLLNHRLLAIGKSRAGNKPLFQIKNFFVIFQKDLKMAGAVIESVSSKKLYIGLGLFLACVVLGFTVGGLFEAPPR